MKPHLITAAALAGIISASLAGPARALDEHDSYRPFGAGPLTCGNFARAVDGLDPRDKDSPKVTFTNYKRFVNGWLTAADRFIPGLNDATGGRDADWFTGVLVNHCRANPSLTIADALEQIINIRFPRLFAEKASPLTHRSTATNNMLDKPPADETFRAPTDRAEAAVTPPELPRLSDKPSTTPSYLGLDDIARIHSTYNANQARFFRDFAGRHFSSKMPITRISENPIFRGSFDVFFGGGGLLGDVKCEFSDKNDVARITEMNKGDIVNVIGVIKDHSFGVIELKECSISTATDADWSLYSGMDALVPAQSATTGNKDADVMIENMKTYATNCGKAYFRTKSGTFRTLDLLNGGLGECQFLTLNNTMPGTVADKKIMDRYIEINDLPTRAEQDKEIDKEPALTIGAMFEVRDAVTNIFMAELASHCTYLGGHNDTSEVSCK